MKPSPFMLCAALMMSTGCATKPPPLVVARGQLINHHDDFELRVARYRLSEIQRGSLASNVVEVVFWQKTQTAELPEQAILLLSRPLAISPPIWHAVGGDASRGILPDTPANRHQIASLANTRILDSPRGERLPRPKAEQIVRDYLRTQSIDVARARLELSRGEFGWKAYIVWPDEQGQVACGGWSLLGIRDTGDILYWNKGL